MVELRERAHHVGDLPLICSAGAHNSLLNLHRRVLADLERAFRKRHECSTAGMRRGDGRANVGAKVNALDSSGIGSITLHDTLKVAGDVRQAHRERTARAGLDTTVGTAANLSAPFLDNPPTRMGQTGVDTQDNQANLPSSQARHKATPRALFTNVCSRITQRQPHKSAEIKCRLSIRKRAPGQSEQGALKEEGIDLAVMPDD